jgi:hypothetical protein
MSQPVADWVGDELIWSRRRRAKIAVRVWRRTSGRPQFLFMFVGRVDEDGVALVMQQVRRLIDTVPGSWRIEVHAVGLDGSLLREVKAALAEMQRTGTPARLAHRPRLRPELRALLMRTALLPS